MFVNCAGLGILNKELLSGLGSTEPATTGTSYTRTEKAWRECSRLLWRVQKGTDVPTGGSDLAGGVYFFLAPVPYNWPATTVTSSVFLLWKPSAYFQALEVIQHLHFIHIFFFFFTLLCFWVCTCEVRFFIYLTV